MIKSKSKSKCFNRNQTEKKVLPIRINTYAHVKVRFIGVYVPVQEKYSAWDGASNINGTQPRKSPDNCN